jgi:hypothetical protein
MLKHAAAHQASIAAPPSLKAASSSVSLAISASLAAITAAIAVAALAFMQRKFFFKFVSLLLHYP